MSSYKTEASEQKRQAAIKDSVNESLESQVSKLSAQKSEVDSENKKLADANSQKAKKISQLEKVSAVKDSRLEGLAATVQKVQGEQREQDEHYQRKLAERELMLKEVKDWRNIIFISILVAFLAFLIGANHHFCGDTEGSHWYDLLMLERWARAYNGHC